MRFEQRIEVPADSAGVWAFLWDVERLARCLPGCQEAREVEPGERYTVVTEERVGPFRARFEMDVRVVERVAGRLVRLRAEGRDRKLAASTRVELEVTLEERAERRDGAEHDSGHCGDGKDRGAGAVRHQEEGAGRGDAVCPGDGVGVGRRVAGDHVGVGYISRQRASCQLTSLGRMASMARRS